MMKILFHWKILKHYVGTIFQMSLYTVLEKALYMMLKILRDAKTSMIDTSIAVKNFADKYNVKRIIFLSSAAVYGNSLDGPKNR